MERCKLRFQFPVILLVLFALGAEAANGCTVPVFRYALDRWQPSRFAIESNQQVDNQWPAWLETIANRDDLNLDLQQSTEPLDAVYGNRSPAALWQGKLDEAMLQRLIDSPARVELAKRLLSGESVVWVYVGGDEPQDAERITAIEARLAYFQSISQLPEINLADPANWMGPGPELALKFSLLRVRRDDPAEEMFIRLLLGPEPGALAEANSFVAPVFGRGRVLVAVDAKAADDEAIDELCFYLTGACSCQVKEQNPGWDLLLKTNWDVALQEAEERRLAANERKLVSGDAGPTPNSPVPASPLKSAETSVPKTINRETVANAPPETVVFGASETGSAPPPKVARRAPANPPRAGSPTVGLLVTIVAVVLALAFLLTRPNP